MKKTKTLSQIKSTFSGFGTYFCFLYDGKSHFLTNLIKYVITASVILSTPLPTYADLSSQSVEEIEQQLSDLPSENISDLEIDNSEPTQEDISVIRSLVEGITEIQVSLAVDKIIEDSKDTSSPIQLTAAEKKSLIKGTTEAVVTFIFKAGLLKDQISRIISRKLPVTVAVGTLVSAVTNITAFAVTPVMPGLGAAIALIPFGTVTLIGMLPIESTIRYFKSKKKYGFSYTDLDKFNNVYMGYNNNNDLSYYSLNAEDTQLVIPVENNVLKLSKNVFYSTFISKMESVKAKFTKNDLGPMSDVSMAYLNRTTLENILNDTQKKISLLRQSRGNISSYHGLLIAEIQKDNNKFRELVRYSTDNYNGSNSEARELILKIKVLKQRMKIVLEKTAVSRLTIPLRLQRSGFLKFKKTGLRSEINAHIKKRKELARQYNQLITVMYDALYAAKLNDLEALAEAEEKLSEVKKASVILIPKTISGYRQALNIKRQIMEAEAKMAPSCAISLLGQ